MENNIKNILTAELQTSTNYLERIFHAIINITHLNHLEEFERLCHHLHFDSNNLITTYLLKEYFQATDLTARSPQYILEKNKLLTNLLTTFLRLDFNENKTVELSVNFINLQYEHAHKFHLFCDQKSNIEIQYPRINVIEMHELDNCNIPKFSLSLETIQEFKLQKKGLISSLEWQRNKKYESLILKGHEAVYHKSFQQALDFFFKARNLKETAEVLTLIGWINSLTGQLETAKTYCLKAIQRDPDYGPPYNDLGSYLMQQGQLEEGLKWFALAKKAPFYQNREYPYINAGRAYMAQKKFSKALEEFSKALTLAPYHDELHETVRKLKISIEKESPPANRINNDFSFPNADL